MLVYKAPQQAIINEDGEQQHLSPLYMPKNLILGLIAILLLSTLLLSSNSHAGSVYRWKDNSGIVHYGEHPPQGVNATLLNTTTGKSSKNKRKNTNRSRVEPGDDTGAAALPEISEEDVQVETVVKPRKDKAVCERARYNLQILTERARIRQKDENGEERYLSEEEKEVQRKTAQDAVDTYC